MDPDFTIRNELDSISHSREDNIESLLNRYAESFGETSSAPSSNNTAVSGMLASLQSSLGFLHRDNQFIKSKLGDDSSANTGVKLVIGPDTLKWIVLLLVILILVVIFLKSKKKKKNPFKKKVLALESEVRALKRQNPFNE